jgi:hypothetical protein
MKRNLRTALASVGIASAIAVGAVAAQDATATPTPDASAQVMPGQGMRGRLAERVGTSEMATLIQEYTGLDATALRDALRSGSTLADLITANGRTVEDFTAAATALFEANQAERLTAFQERLTQMLNGELRPELGGRRGGMRPGMGEGMRPGGRGVPPTAAPGTGT